MYISFLNVWDVVIKVNKSNNICKKHFFAMDQRFLSNFTILFIGARKPQGDTICLFLTLFWFN